MRQCFLLSERAHGRASLAVTALGAAVLLTPMAAHAGGAPWAVEVISYQAGMGTSPGFTNPASALGEPTRFTGVGIFPSVVSPFSPPFLGSEIVAIGLGGQLTLRLGTPAVDDPANPFGVDLIVFSNGFFTDGDFPNGLVGGGFGLGEGSIELSDDGIEWHLVPDVAARDLFPPLGYLDAGPFDLTPGRVPSDFHLPVDPSIDLDALLFLDYEALMAVYAGSGGGVGVDLASVGLASAEFVRISVAGDAPGQIAIDAVTVVIPRSSRIFGDLDGDGIVDGADLGILLQSWGPCDGCPADLNGDGVVDGADLGRLLGAWSGGA